jgi:hypothetical protein
MKRFRNIIVHPLLFSIYPVLSLFFINISEVYATDLIMPLLATLGLGVCIWVVAGLVLRNKIKSAFIAGLSMLMLLLFRHAYVLFTYMSGGWAPGRKYFLIVWFVLYLAGVFVILRTKKDMFQANQLANFISVTLILTTLLSLLEFRPQPKTSSDLSFDASKAEWVKKWHNSRAIGPDVYYIILDGYGRADKLEKYYGFNNKLFIERLKSKGFRVANKSTSNYSFTHESIASSLNMDYVHDKHYKAERSQMKKLIRYNKVAQIFRSLGYKCVWVPSGFYITDQSPLADITINLGIKTQSQLSSLLIENSSIWFSAYWININWDFLRREGIQRGVFYKRSTMMEWQRQIIESIKAIPEVAKIKEPTFTFAHIICPHGPFVFNRDGSLNERSKMADLGGFDNTNYWHLSEQFVDQLIYLNTLLEEMVTKILENSSERPIIIFQGDHGTAYNVGKQWINPEHPSKELVKERMSIFFAYYEPDPVHDNFYDSITPVNFFRTIFNKYFGAEFSLLSDKNIWTFVQPMQDVTYLVNN